MKWKNQEKSMNNRLNILSAVIIAGLCLQKAGAQDGVQNLWLSGGVGIGGKDFAGMLKLAFQAGDRTFSARWTATDEIFGILGNGSSPHERTRELSLLYEIAGHRSRWTFVSVSAGAGLVTGHLRGRYLTTQSTWLWGSSSIYEDVKFTTPGVALDVETSLTPFSFLGVGTNIFANINARSSYLGFLLTIQLGKVN